MIKHFDKWAKKYFHEDHDIYDDDFYATTDDLKNCWDHQQERIDKIENLHNSIIEKTILLIDKIENLHNSIIEKTILLSDEKNRRIKRMEETLFELCSECEWNQSEGDFYCVDDETTCKINLAIGEIKRALCK